jgi:hypothetical protein
MQNKSCAGLLSVVAALAVLGLSPSVVRADTIAYQQLIFVGPVLGSSTSGDVSVSGTSLFDPNYSFSGEFCENSSCGNPIGTTDDSLLRLTNLTLTCNGDGDPCGPVDITFEALGAMSNGSPVPSTPVNVDLSFDGVGSASGFARICIGSSVSFCTSEGSGPQSFQFSFFNNLSGSASGAVVAPGGFDVYGDLHFDGLADGTSVQLNNSLDIGITNAGAVPEPSTFAMLAAGMTLLGLTARRRMSAGASRK